MKLTIRSQVPETYDINRVPRGSYFRVVGQGTGYLRTQTGAVALDSGIVFGDDALRGRSLVLLTDVEITATDND